LLACLLLARPASAQDESKLHAELRREGERIRENCTSVDAKQLASCVVTLATDHPVHVAFGNIAPLNGFGLGAAFGTTNTPNENWSLRWSGDAVRAFGGAWRAGMYLKIIQTTVPEVKVVKPGAGSSPSLAIRPYPVYNVYAQTISLPRLTYYGLGRNTTRTNQAFFGLGQTVVGTSAIVPLSRFTATRALNLSLVGEVNGRIVDVRSAPSDDRPSIEELYTEATAPGLTRQPGFLQLGEGVRIKPSLAGGRLRLDYLAKLQQFIAPSDSTYSFRRWTIDLRHDVPLYRTFAPADVRDTNGPNDCAIDVTTNACPSPLPPPSASRNRTGTVGFRLFASRSSASDASVVPFYFQPTLGGSDINGQRLLPSYDDYRFRGPRVLVLQETLEHSIWGPLGLWLAADQGKVSLDGSRADGFLHSYALGLSLRAGGFPFVLVSWATGGGEGSHVAFTVSTSLLGGSARPSLH
jgi:hypothetical protein